MSGTEFVVGLESNGKHVWVGHDGSDKSVVRGSGYYDMVVMDKKVWWSVKGGRKAK